MPQAFHGRQKPHNAQYSLALTGLIPTMTHEKGNGYLVNILKSNVLDSLEQSEEVKCYSTGCSF